MPKYRNDSTGTTYRLTNWSGEKETVEPGETIRTYQELTEDDFTLISAKPYYNETLKVTQPSGAGPHDVSLHKKTDRLEIYNESSFDIRVFFNSKSNTPATRVFASSNRTFSDLKNRFNSVHLEFDGSVGSGELTLTQFRE